MQAVLAVTAPFFALVLCGYLAARQRVLPYSAIGRLNNFVLYFALPCMLFRFGAGTPVLDLLNPTLLAIWLIRRVPRHARGSGRRCQPATHRSRCLRQVHPSGCRMD